MSNQETKTVRAATAQEIEAAQNRAAEKSAEADKPAPKFIGNTTRSAVITLKYPMEYDGVEYKEVTVRRITGSELQNLDRSGDPAISLMHLLTDIPHRVLQALDADDFAEINAVGADFLPRRLMEAAEQIQNDGQDTQQT